jgi:hypothetical protein
MKSRCFELQGTFERDDHLKFLEECFAQESSKSVWHIAEPAIKMSTFTPRNIDRGREHKSSVKSQKKE